MTNPAVVAIGECMLELSQGFTGGESWRLRYGGDTLNAAVYLARLGENVAYLTALGTDRYSASMREGWAAEGIDTSLVLTHPERLPGLYLIETDECGERRFHYWRERSAARALFDCEGARAALDVASRAELIYLSGITLSLFDDAGRQRLLALCDAVRARGGQVAFDPNYRPLGWPSPESARAAISAIAPKVTIALPTFEDEALLHGDSSPETSIARWKAYGVPEIALKRGPDGAIVVRDGETNPVSTTPNAAPRDTTGAGDSFNGAYLAARRSGADPAAAAAVGNRLAAAVLSQPGAIIPKAVMPLNLTRTLSQAG